MRTHTLALCERPWCLLLQGFHTCLSYIGHTPHRDEPAWASGTVFTRLNSGPRAPAGLVSGTYSWKQDGKMRLSDGVSHVVSGLLVAALMGMADAGELTAVARINPVLPVSVDFLASSW
jgi:hypothetical protein